MEASCNSDSTSEDDIDELPLSARLQARSGTSKSFATKRSTRVIDTSKRGKKSKKRTPCSKKIKKSNAGITGDCSNDKAAAIDTAHRRPCKRKAKPANASAATNASNILKGCTFLIAQTYSVSQSASLRREIERAGGKVRVNPSDLIDYCVQSYSDELYDERLESICNDYDIPLVPPAFVRDCIAHNRLHGLQEWFFGVDAHSRKHPLNEFNPRSALARWTQQQKQQPRRQVEGLHHLSVCLSARLSVWLAC